MKRKPNLPVLVIAGLFVWLVVAAAHDLAAPLAGPLLPRFAWMFP